MDLWIVGQYRGGTVPDTVWDFQGVFSNEELAVKACSTESHFVAPATLDEEIPDEPHEWPGAYYPLLES